MRERSIALLSGGLDSTVAVSMAMRETEVALALTFDYGQRAAKREVEAARALCGRFGIDHRTIDLPWLADLGSSALTHAARPLPAVSAATLDQGAKGRAEEVWVPNRNGLFIAVAASYAESMGAARIIAGFNAEEANTFPDNGEEFIEATDRSLSLSTLSGVKILCPTREMDKRAVAAEFMNLGLPPSSFWCCYEGGMKLCGRCESCCRAIRAFDAIGAIGAIMERLEVPA